MVDNKKNVSKKKPVGDPIPHELTTTWICKRCKFQGTIIDSNPVPGQQPTPPSPQGCSVSSSGNHNWAQDKAPSIAYECYYCGFYGESADVQLSISGCPNPGPSGNYTHLWYEVAPNYNPPLPNSDIRKSTKK